MQVATARAEQTTGAEAAPQSRLSPLDRARRRLLVPFVFPALVVYTAIMVLPTIFTFWISLNRWAGAGPMEWAGWDNYTAIVRDPTLSGAFVNTFWIVVGVGAGVFFISFAITMVVHGMAGRKFVRAVVFFPSLVPGIAVSILWGYLFNSDGLLNKLLATVGAPPVPWLAEDNLFKVVMLGLVWLSVGTYTVIFMASVDRIPPELYEAAEIDGASAFYSFTRITLPLMWDVVSVCTILWCVGALKTFDFLLTFGGSSYTLPPRKIWNVALYSYGAAFSPDGTASYGVSAACGVLVLLLTVILTILARRVTRRESLNY